MGAEDYPHQTKSLSADSHQHEAVALHDSCTEHRKKIRHFSEVIACNYNQGSKARVKLSKHQTVCPAGL